MTAAGVYLPDSERRDQNRGVVVAISESGRQLLAERQDTIPELGDLVSFLEAEGTVTQVGPYGESFDLLNLSVEAITSVRRRKDAIKYGELAEPE